MIPADVVSRLQVAADTALRPVAQTQEISDKLSGLVSGQKVMAEIQSLLPNGTYRALINQRNITLALPFSAKSGDSLELQVTESNGKLTLAVLSHDSSGDKQNGAKESVSATLSKTGQLISSLYSGTRDGKGSAVGLPLNNSQPISTEPPLKAQDILPLLKQSITQSGMFYESHQAEWVEGRFTKNALLQEPQGKLSSPAAFAHPLPNETAQATTVVQDDRSATAQNKGIDGARSNATQTTGQLVAAQTQPIIQQQLEALATQNFVWQGQVWPGQDMRWEIEEDGARQHSADEDSPEKWATSLRLVLPNLGEIDARIRLDGNNIALKIGANSSDTRALIRSATASLRSQLNEAGLTLASMGIETMPEGTNNGQTEQ